MDKNVVKKLQPFIVASWHGHRNDKEIPEIVRKVWQKKFNGQRGNNPRNQSNVDIAVVDASGKLVHSFDGFRFHNSGRRQSLGQYTATQLQKAIAEMDLKTTIVKERPIQLPDLKGKRGVRMFVSLKDDRMIAYQAPVVELVEWNDSDWSVFEWREKERTIDASKLEKWLAQIYPPGVMERTNPRTKFVYQIESVEGQLTLTPAGADQNFRYACLSGTIRLIDEGPDGFSYKGELNMVMAYKKDDTAMTSFRGVFEGIYPRIDRVQNRTRNLPLTAVFESRPE